MYIPSNGLPPSKSALVIMEMLVSFLPAFQSPKSLELPVVAIVIESIVLNSH